MAAPTAAPPDHDQSITAHDDRLDRTGRRAPVLVAALLLLVALGVVVLLPGGAGPTGPVAPGAAGADTVPTVEVGVHVLSVGQVDLGAGTYTVDMYVLQRCPGGSLDCELGELEFLNGRASSSQVLLDEPGRRELRVQADLRTTPDLHRYPFDDQRLTIQLEDTVRSLDEVRLVAAPDLTSLDPSVVLTGWRMTGWDAEVTARPHPMSEADFSQLVVTMDLDRPPLSSVLKVVVPALVIVLSGLLSLLLGAGHVLQRLGICTSALVGGIMFHINITSQLPPVGYLTVADRFMLANYAALVGALAATVVLLALERPERDGFGPVATRVHRWAGIVLPAAWVALLVVVLGPALVG